MTTRLTLICHGATVATRASAFPDDDPLEPRALSALRGPSAVAGHADESAVSPMLAARRTAEALGLAATVDAGLRDLDVGTWAGRALADVGRSEPDELARWLADADFDAHGGESLSGLLRRCGAWLERRTGVRGHTVAVTHAALVRAMVIDVLAAPAAAFWRIDVVPLSLTDLRHDGRRWAVRSCGAPLSGVRA